MTPPTSTPEVITNPRYFVLAGSFQEFQKLIQQYPEMRQTAHYIPRWDTLMGRVIPPPGHPDRPIVILTGTWQSLSAIHRHDIIETLRSLGFKSEEFRWL